jgi:hypothetical protein
MRIATLIALSTMVLASPVMAQPVPASADQALSHCLVLKSTGADRQALVRWILGSLASSSLATGMVKVDAAAKEEADRAVAATYTRLLKVDCLSEYQAMTKTGDSSGMQSAFAMLGQIAMHDAAQDPSVSAALTAFTHYIPQDATKK